MTSAEASIASAGAVQFLGKETAYWRLRIKGAALLMLTLGLYRFWFATDIRRFLWSNTEIAGDTLEYTGLATELLVGFLFAVAILVPLYTGLRHRRARTEPARAGVGWRQPFFWSRSSANSRSIAPGATG